MEQALAGAVFDRKFIVPDGDVAAALLFIAVGVDHVGRKSALGGSFVNDVVVVAVHFYHVSGQISAGTVGYEPVALNFHLHHSGKAEGAVVGIVKDVVTDLKSRHVGIFVLSVLSDRGHLIPADIALSEVTAPYFGIQAVVVFARLVGRGRNGARVSVFHLDRFPGEHDIRLGAFDLGPDGESGKHTVDDLHVPCAAKLHGVTVVGVLEDHVFDQKIFRTRKYKGAGSGHVFARLGTKLFGVDLPAALNGTVQVDHPSDNGNIRGAVGARTGGVVVQNEIGVDKHMPDNGKFAVLYPLCQLLGIAILHVFHTSLQHQRDVFVQDQLRDGIFARREVDRSAGLFERVNGALYRLGVVLRAASDRSEEADVHTLFVRKFLHPDLHVVFSLYRYVKGRFISPEVVSRYRRFSRTVAVYKDRISLRPRHCGGNLFVSGGKASRKQSDLPEGKGLSGDRVARHRRLGRTVTGSGRFLLLVVPAPDKCKQGECTQKNEDQTFPKFFPMIPQNAVLSFLLFLLRRVSLLRA